MNYQVSTKKGEPVAVGLRESGEGVYEITIEGETVHVDAVKSGPTVYSMIEDGKQFEAMVDEKGAHGFDVLLGGRIFHLEAIDERTQLLAGSAHAVVSGPQSIEAEMPGKVVMLSASVGDAVEEGHGVLVIEAMKMENEIRSPITGVIREISVSVGDTVESGTALFTVDPPAEN